MSVAVVIDMRQRIIEAAITVAAQSGFAQATTREIAREADCSEGIIYHYFASKNELFLAVIKENAEAFLRRLKDEVEGAGTAKEKLEGLVDFHFHYFTGKTHIFQILFGKSGDGMVPFPHVLKTIILPYLRFIEHIIARGVQTGEFHSVRPNLFASNLLGMMQFNIIKLHFGVKDNSVDEIKDMVKYLIIKPLLKARP